MIGRMWSICGHLYTWHCQVALALDYLYMNIVELNKPLNVYTIVYNDGHSISQYVSLILLIMCFQYTCTYLFPASCHL